MKDERGQALAEFALAALVFFPLVFGVIDFGRAIYQFNGVSQAAREIARVASVYPASDFTNQSTWPQKIKDVVAVQKRLIPNLDVRSIKCVDTNGNAATPCDFSTDSVMVEAHAPFTGVTPGISMLGTFDMKGVSSVQIQ
jgi:Flp pilus assembly protein TadG